MKKAILIMLTACLVCACGQKGPLVPPETLFSEIALPGKTETLLSQF